MKKIEVEIYETAKGEYPKNNTTVLVWTYLLSAERARYTEGAFYMGDGRKWLLSPLSRVLMWCELYFAPVDDGFPTTVDSQGNPNSGMVAEMIAGNQTAITIAVNSPTAKGGNYEKT